MSARDKIAPERLVDGLVVARPPAGDPASPRLHGAVAADVEAGTRARPAQLDSRCDLLGGSRARSARRRRRAARCSPPRASRSPAAQARPRATRPQALHARARPHHHLPTHPAASSSGAAPSQRAISQPFWRENLASTCSPRNVPVTVAVSGPPYCWVQATFPGVGSNTSAFSSSTARQSEESSGASHSTVAVFGSRPPEPPVDLDQEMRQRGGGGGRLVVLAAAGDQGRAHDERDGEAHALKIRRSPP